MARIIVVDDDELILEMLAQRLERQGYDVVTATDGDKGLRYCQQQVPDLVITDLIMPEKEGLETIMALQKDFPATKIIAISGGGRIDPRNYLESAKRLGAAYTFVKPIVWDALLDAIKELLKEKETV